MFVDPVSTKKNGCKPVAMFVHQTDIELYRVEALAAKGNPEIDAFPVEVPLFVSVMRRVKKTRFPTFVYRPCCTD